MIVLFYFMEDTKVTINEFGFTYEHKFDKIPNKDRKNIPAENIYFSTPSDFKTHMDTLKKNVSEDQLKDLVFLMKPDDVIKHHAFPKNIGFADLEEQIGQYKGQPTFKVSILNAMSNAMGDHLIGMRAFDIWQDKLRKLLPGTQVEITLHQLSPYRTGPITRQWNGKFQQVFMMPNRLSRLMEYDAFVDLGGFLLNEDFGKMTMMDFYLKALSIDPKSVPVEQKRMEFKIPEQNKQKIKSVFDIIRSQGRPILLFHHHSTSQIRSMREGTARKAISDIIENSDYLVVSASPLEYQDKRFLSLADYSQTLDDFAAIISEVDAIITVDTSTYHFADAFSIPTVVLFTSIDPSLRIPYYPHTRGIMLEDSEGMLYGRHKINKDKEEEETEYTEAMWGKFDITEALNELQTIGG